MAGLLAVVILGAPASATLNEVFTHHDFTRTTNGAWLSDMVSVNAASEFAFLSWTANLEELNVSVVDNNGALLYASQTFSCTGFCDYSQLTWNRQGYLVIYYYDPAEGGTIRLVDTDNPAQAPPGFEECHIASPGTTKARSMVPVPNTGGSYDDIVLYDYDDARFLRVALVPGECSLLWQVDDEEVAGTLVGGNPGNAGGGLIYNEASDYLHYTTESNELARIDATNGGSPDTYSTGAPEFLWFQANGYLPNGDIDPENTYFAYCITTCGADDVTTRVYNWSSAQETTLSTVSLPDSALVGGRSMDASNIGFGLRRDSPASQALRLGVDAGFDLGSAGTTSNALLAIPDGQGGIWVVNQVLASVFSYLTYEDGVDYDTPNPPPFPGNATPPDDPGQQSSVPGQVPYLEAFTKQVWDGDSSTVRLLWLLSPNDPDPDEGNFTYQIWSGGQQLGTDELTALDGDGFRVHEIEFGGTTAQGERNYYIIAVNTTANPDLESTASCNVSVSDEIQNDFDSCGDPEGGGGGPGVFNPDSDTAQGLQGFCTALMGDSPGSLFLCGLIFVVTVFLGIGAAFASLTGSQGMPAAVAGGVGGLGMMVFNVTAGIWALVWGIVLIVLVSGLVVYAVRSLMGGNSGE